MGHEAKHNYKKRNYMQQVSGNKYWFLNWHRSSDRILMKTPFSTRSCVCKQILFYVHEYILPFKQGDQTNLNDKSTAHSNQRRHGLAQWPCATAPGPSRDAPPERIGAAVHVA